jgi:hypothetical protein
MTAVTAVVESKKSGNLPRRPSTKVTTAQSTIDGRRFSEGGT